MDFECDFDPPPPAFRLRGRQQEWSDKVEADESTGHRRLLFVAPGGIGKSSVMGHLAQKKWREQNIRTLITENREHLVEQTAGRIREETGLNVGIEMASQSASPYDPVVVASTQSLGRTNRLTSFAPDHFGFVVPDECFPCNVLVDGKPISEIRTGDFVTSFNHEKKTREIRRVTCTKKSVASSLVELNCEGQRLVCTHSHPLFSEGGYRRAIELRVGDKIARLRNPMRNMRNENIPHQDVNKRREASEACAAMREVQKTREGRQGDCTRSPMQELRYGGALPRVRSIIHKSSGNHGEPSLLHPGVSGCVAEKEPPNARGAKEGRSRERLKAHEGKESNVEPCYIGENESIHERQNVSEPGWQWIPDGATDGFSRRDPGQRNGVFNRDLPGGAHVPIGASCIQGGYCDKGDEAGHRSGWEQSQDKEVEVFGSPKDGDIEFVRVDGVEVLEQGGHIRFGEVCPDGFVYNLEVEGNNNYFADGILVHNCHLSLAPQSQRILNYHHFGADSLREDWQRPREYEPLSTVCGFTASPNLGASRSLGEWYSHVSVNYSYLDAIQEGWLVGLREENIPVTIDTRKFRTRRTTEGADFNIADQAAAIIPIIRELAMQIVRYAADKKTICFLPSVECARLMAETLQGMGMRAIFASGECLDKGEKTDAYNAAPKGTVFCNCALVTYGVDFVDTDCIAPFAAMISKCRYVQSVYRGTRVLRGVLREGMTEQERRAAIAASAKPYCTVLSPFFISDRIDLCEPFDLFSDLKRKKRTAAQRDLTEPENIRDWVKSLEKAADPHQNKQARSIDPVAYSLSVGGERIAAIAEPGAAPASRAELDALLAFGMDTTQVRSSAQAQRLISTLRERDRLGLASPKAIHQLTLRLGWPDELASKMKGRQAGVLIAKGVRYKAPQEVAADDPALAYGEG